MKEDLRLEISAFVARCSASAATATSWEEPLVGFVSADDPGFDEVRRVLGPKHAMPRDLMPNAASAIALFVPYARALARDNRKGELASRSWCVAFDDTRQMLIALGAHLHEWLQSRGHTLCAIPDSHGFDPERIAADWSHKHVSVLAGLGRPGRHNMLITRSGSFGRGWSYLCDVPLESDPRVEHEPCMTLGGRECTRCVDRCVGAALTLDGYDPRACYDQCLKNEGRFPELPVTDLCGKCMLGAPCTHVDPMARIGRRESERAAATAVSLSTETP